jgi:predicted alpha/beta hydrolase
MGDWGKHDLEGVLRFAHQEWNGRPLVAIGHSVGGQILGQPASNHLYSRAVTIGSQFGSWQLWPGARKWAMAGLWYGLMPALTHTLGYFPGSLGIGADLPKEVALEWARWCRSPEFFLAHGVSRDGYSRLKIPMLSFSFEDDTYAPKAAVDALHSLYAQAQIERRHVVPRDLGVKEIGHFGFFRDTFRPTLWEGLGEFVFGAVASSTAA